MNPLRIHNGIVIPLDRANVDTDAIIPKQFLKSIKKTGFGPNLFDEWRYLDQGEPGEDVSKREINPDFILNIPRYHKGSILLTRENFGCGSSREHAPWALLDFGIRVIIAPSFADIFYGNCFKNGILPIVVTKEECDLLFKKCENNPRFNLTINLEQQKVIDGEDEILFDVDSFKKNCLIDGLDDIGLTLKDKNKILEFEKVYQAQFPWLIR
jgi:3-isopropylmalate/(R)-2-methylmalate dehydratase small subunit